MESLERQESGGEAPTSLGAVTDQLRLSIERQIAGIVEAAEQRALQIEQQATERAATIERDAAGEARETLEATLGRAWAILGGLDDLESRFDALRLEVKTLVDDLDSRVGVGTSDASTARGHGDQERAGDQASPTAPRASDWLE